jgi:hypothetical protein
MDGLFAQAESWEDAVHSVESNLLFEFRDQLPPDLIGEVARECVEQFRQETVRIRTFIPLLALRVARDRLRFSTGSQRRPA